jgi:hypothetical protein
MSQVSLWQSQQQSAQYAELCDALYERELQLLANASVASVTGLQARLKSLPYYIKRTAHLMTEIESPMDLDVQNATWSSKQMKLIPLASQLPEEVWQWYQNINLLPGLVVPIALRNKIVIDSVDRIDNESSRFRTSAFGWFDQQRAINDLSIRLLKPNKKVMMAACSGHCWGQAGMLRPSIPSMRELLLSCSINWKNFKRPIAI